jgi:DNA ligase-1
MQFKPILAPNEEVDLKDIPYPILASYKLDGIRCIFLKGKMLSRSLKPIVNKQLREKFQPIADYTAKQNLILDGEIYSHELTFQEITSFVMTQDFEDEKSIKKYGKILLIPESLKFNCFDCLKIKNTTDEVIETLNTPFIRRLQWTSEARDKFSSLMTVLQHEYIDNENEVENYFQKALAEGYEGLILRNGEGHYKFGRCTVKENTLFKVKPFRTFDGKIIEVTQGTEVNPNAEKTINELGMSVTSKKKNDRVLINRVRDFVIEYGGDSRNKCHILKVSSSSLTHKERENLWKIKDTLIGQWIEYKGMLVGSKDVPRHPVFIRFRESKE